ncbi:cupin domain-containing protein [Allomuricauda sp. d1]|uniref:cupin domain-containing protein n=1 Tax=Allomuricauda sp. d1 TaxID=3136725 RepID=UPI0031D5B92F
MDRKRFLTQLGGTGLMTILPISTAKAIVPKVSTNSEANEAKIVKNGEGTELRIFGNPQWHKVVGGDTGNQVFEWVDDLAPGSGIPPHVHTKEDEIFRVLEGEVEIMVDGKVTVLKAGDMAFAPKNIPHAWKVVGDQKAKMWVSAFPSGMEHMFHELNALPSGPPDFEKVSAICETYGIRFV